MKKSLTVIAGLVVMAGLVGSPAGAAPQRSATLAALQGDNLTPLPPAVSPVSPDQSSMQGAAQGRFGLLVDGGYYGNASIECGYKLILDPQYHTINLVAIQNPLNSSVCQNPGATLVAKCSGDDAQNCEIEGMGRTLSVNESFPFNSQSKNNTVYVSNFTISPGLTDQYPTTFEYAESADLPFTKEMTLPAGDTCKALRNIAESEALQSCGSNPGSRGFASCEITDTSILVDNATTPDGVYCKLTVTVHGSNLPVKHGWFD